MAYEYGCFGYGMMSGGYGYGWMIFSWLIGLLAVAGLVVFILWMIKKMQYDNVHEKNSRRTGFLERTYDGRRNTRRRK